MANIIGVNPPVLNDEDYVDKIKNSLDSVDAHDHSPGKGVAIPAGALAAGSIDNDDINAAAAIARTKLASGTADHVVINSGTGAMSSEAQLDKTRGGTGISSTATFPASGVIVTEAGSQSLTNKTIDADSNTITNIENADIKSGAAIARNKLASGTLNHVVINDGSGVMSSEAQLATSRGGTGVNSTATFPSSGTVAVVPSSGVVKSNGTALSSSNVNLASEVTGTLPIANGGTGATTKTDAFDALAPTTTAGDFIVYNGTDNVRQGIGTDGQVLVVDTSLGNKLKWTSLQQGAKNYITYNNFENNALTGWNEASVTWTSGAPSGAPTVSATAAASIALSVTSTTPLAGTYSLQMVGTIAQGQGFCTDVLTIDREDQAKVLQGSFYYEVTAGATNANFSGTSSNTLCVYIYDVTNSAWIQPAGVYNLVQSSGQGLCTFTFQTPASISQLRLFVFAANTASGSITMEFDDFALGPQKILSGAAISDWQSFTPTGTWTANTTYTGAYRRVGDSMELWYKIATSGAPTTATLAVNMPTGFSIDTAKLDSDTDSYVNGQVSITDAGVATYIGRVRYISATQFELPYLTSTDVLANTTQAAPMTFGAGDEVHVHITRVPIVGWSSNTVMSSDTDTRVVAFSVKSVGTGTFTHTLSSSFQNLPAGFWGTPTVNTHGSFDSATNGGEYTVPVSGIYEIQFQAGWIFSSVGVRSSRILIDGIAVQQSCDIVTSATINTTAPLVSYTTFLNAGQKIRCQAYQNSGGNLNYDISSSGVYNIFAVKKLSGPATIAANELVACRYTNCTTAFGTTNAIAIFGTRDFDTHGFYNSSTGVASIPIGGKYRISASFNTGSGTAASINTYAYLQIRINSVVKCVLATFSYQVASALSAVGNGSCIVNLNAGDTLDVTTIRDSGAPAVSMLNNNFTWLNIERIGY